MNSTQLNLLITLKNTACAGKELLVIEYNIDCLKILSFLYAQGLIQSFCVTLNKIEISLRFYNGLIKLQQLKLVSKNSYFKYLNHKMLCKLPSDKYLIAFSTDKGYLNLSNCKFKNIGGKILFIC